jgi:hypothetical protein
MGKKAEAMVSFHAVSYFSEGWGRFGEDKSSLSNVAVHPEQELLAFIDSLNIQLLNLTPKQ